VLSGLACARLSILELDPAASFTAHAADGDIITKGTQLASVEGDARAILSAERTALNLLSRLCGVATLTRAYVAAVAGTKARIVDTRKTTPGLRALEKYAVRCGGGFNHRFGLDDAILIKDNHIGIAGSITVAVARVRAQHGATMPVQVEVDTLAQLEEALGCGVSAVLLDNMPPEMLRRAVALVAGRCHTEASGGITPDNIREVAATGVDSISLGSLTHSVRVLDLGLDLG
jgi:nicotinate-nucleotide pyrophosphorylase (carboxylating)